MIPLVNPAIARQSSATQPWLRGAIRWIVVVLALVAMLDAAYMTWTSFTHGIVAGCSGGEAGGCDEVLGSRWSRAAGLPVAIGGLVCYGSILVLALLAGTRSFNTNRWLGTTLATLALLAALSGIYFTLLQVFVLGASCYYCLATHVCGLIIAGLVLWAAQSKRPSQAGASRSHNVLVAAIPGAPGVRRPAVARPAERLSLLAAWPTAGALVALLIAVQVLFPAKTFEANNPELDETIDMTATVTPATDSDDDELSPTAQTHTVNRLAEADVDDDEQSESGSESSDEAVLAAKADVDSNPSDSVTDNDADADNVADDAPPAADEPPALKREVTFLNGKMKIDMYAEAVLGSPDAEYVVVELMDYTCPHCRKMHAHIQEAMDRYGDQLAVVIMPVPLELECNPSVQETDPMHRGACKIAKLALAVAKASPSKFVDFHHYLLSDKDKAPSPAQAVMRAFRLVGRKEFSKHSNSKEIDQRIQKYIRLLANLNARHKGEKAFGLPVQIVGDTVLNGGDVTEEELFEAWEKAIDIKPL